MTKFEQIRKARDEYKGLVKTTGKEAVAEQLKGLFDAHPELVAVRWAQYTPYFNDGDTCQFGMRDVYYQAKDTAEDAGDYEDGFDSIPWDKKARSPVHSALKNFERSRDEDLFLECFGDHVQVTATRDGVEVEEYDHD